MGFRLRSGKTSFSGGTSIRRPRPGTAPKMPPSLDWLWTLLWLSRLLVVTLRATSCASSPEASISWPVIIDFSLDEAIDDEVEDAEIPLWRRCLSGVVRSKASRPARILASRVVKGVVGVINVADAGDKMSLTD
jgi:hypothetical protein